MKASTFCIIPILVAASLFTSKAFAVTYSVRGDSGTQCYRLDAPAGVTPDQKYLIDADMPYSKVAPFPITAGQAEVAAVGWAGGLLDHDKDAGLYSNSGTNLGAKTPGGFYNAAYVHPVHVERVQGPTGYWLVTMTGVTGGVHQTLYAAVLDDGRLVRPESVPCGERHYPRRHHPMMRHHRHP